MAKRKRGCSLEDFISGYFKKAKFDKSYNLFNNKNVENRKFEKIRTKFVQYLKDQFITKCLLSVLIREFELLQFSAISNMAIYPQKFI